MGVASTIGVFDSGVGGLTVVSAVRQALPSWNIVYLGDTARVPYGSKSARTVERYSLACQAFLLEHDVALIMIACNTASAAALPALRAVGRAPVLGAIEPGARTAVAASSNRHIGVIGTLATVSSRAYERAIHELLPEAHVSSLACPLLVPLAEEGWVDDEIARAVAHRYLSTLFARDPLLDTLVLGCTHYPLLRGVLTSVANELSSGVTIVDSARAMALAAADLLAREAPPAASSARTRLSCFVTDASRLDELGPRFLGEPIDSFELVDL